MKFVTVATNKTPEVLRFLDSCQAFNIPITVLGEGMQYHGHGLKIVLMIEFLKTLADEEIVMYCDSHDTIFLTDPNEIEKKFRKFNHPFVIGAEQNLCIRAWHMFGLPMIRCLYIRGMYYWLKYPNKTGNAPYRFINGGCFVGYAAYMLNLLQGLQVNKNYPCDQRLFHRYYIQHPNAIKLDHKQILFSNTGGRDWLLFEDHKWEINRLKKVVTQTYPAVLHASGKARIGLELLVRKLKLGYHKVPLTKRQKRYYDALNLRQYIIAKYFGDTFIFYFILISLVLLGIFPLLSYLLFLI